MQAQKRICACIADNRRISPRNPIPVCPKSHPEASGFVLQIGNLHQAVPPHRSLNRTQEVGGSNPPSSIGETPCGGAEFVFEAVDLADRVRRADLVLTGEGQIDDQSLSGKLVGEVARLCRRLDTPLHAIVGADRLAPSAAASAGIATIAEAGEEEAIARAATAIVRDFSRSPEP
jgi:glycerate kinase family protein